MPHQCRLNVASMSHQCALNPAWCSSAVALPLPYTCSMVRVCFPKNRFYRRKLEENSKKGLKG